MDKWSLWSPCGASLMGQLVKNLPAMQETSVQSLGQEDPLEKGSDTHCSVLGLPGGSAGEESACMCWADSLPVWEQFQGKMGSIPEF